jgi:hypothetical protein
MQTTQVAQKPQIKKFHILFMLGPDRLTNVTFLLLPQPWKKAAN